MDPSLIYLNDAIDPNAASTHVLIIGVGNYEFGKGPGASPVGGDLVQLSSPPISARAMADWFIGSFEQPSKPLASLSLLISEKNPGAYQPARPAGAAAVIPPGANLANVKAAAGHWAARAGANKNNLAVFYFCGHGASLGQKAALMLEDFGKPGAEFEGAIDLDVLRGTMRNSPTIQQVYLLDCCRTDADDLYLNEANIGSRIVSVPSFARGHDIPAQQFVLFPTIDGETAFGIKDDVSAFTSSILDAMNFAAADPETGIWQTTTAGILKAVDRLVRYRVPAALTNRSKPNTPEASSFEFNVIPEPAVTHSYVTISDLDLWGDVEFECKHETGAHAPASKHSKNENSATCCTFELPEGEWCFKGKLPASPPDIEEHKRKLRIPVAYVTLRVVP